MIDIRDIPYEDVKSFLLGNDVPIPKNIDGRENIEAAYNAVRVLINNPEAGYNVASKFKKVLYYPDNIVLWMYAYNAIQRENAGEIIIPRYTETQIKRLSKPKTEELADILNMKTLNKDAMVQILSYIK